MVGFEQQPSAGYAQIAPNPIESGGSIRLVTDQDDAFELLIWNAKGKLAFQAKNLTNGTKVQPNVGAGIYFYDLRGSSIWYQGKLVVVGQH